MKPILIILLSIVFMGCQREGLRGVYVPQDIEWESPKTGDLEIDRFQYSGFSTFVFYDDLTFFEFSSVQSPSEEDSLLFGTEPGQISRMGRYEVLSDNQVRLDYEKSYWTHGTLPSTREKTQELVSLSEGSDLIIDDLIFEKTNRYTHRSQNMMKALEELARSSTSKN
ncbi:MAG: hypothetical protein SchgKO_00040 [Schleiferiaceae bacterium]